MGNVCCARPAFTALDAGSDFSQLVDQLRERPDLLCNPKPSVLLSLHDSALHYAAEHKATEAAQQIFHFLATADADTLHAALRPYCRRRHMQLPSTNTAAARIAANMTNNKGQTPLMFACYSDCPAMVKLLLEQGADPWVGDNCGCRNALHYAAMAGSVDCVEALMKHTQPHMLVRTGVRYVNSRSLSGLTPLHYCVFFGRETALEQLLMYEPHINAASTGESYDTYGSYDIYSTPLHFAALQDSTPMARQLLLYYARRRRHGTLLDPRMRANSAGKLPWQVARSRALALLLHPSASLSEVLGREGEAALLGLGGGEQALGPPTLGALAAAALRQKLLAAVEVIERECVEEAALQRTMTSRPTGLLRCTTPRRSGVSGGGGAGPSCSPGPRDLLRLASRGRSRSTSRAHSRRHPHIPGTVIPASPREAPTLDRVVHPSDVIGGLADGGAAAAAAAAAAGGGRPSREPFRGRTSRDPTGRARQQQQPHQQQQLQQQQQPPTHCWSSTGFLGAPPAGGGNGGGGAPAYYTAHPLLAVANSVPVGAELPYSPPNLRSASLTAGPNPFGNACGAAGGATALGGDATAELSPTLPGGASPTSPYISKVPLESPLPVGGGASLRDAAAGGGRGSAGLGANGGAAESFPLMTLYGNSVLSPAASIVAGSCVDFDAAAAAAAAATPASAAGVAAVAPATSTADELRGDSGGEDELDGDSDDEGTCNVCFARPEAVMSPACRHCLCTACAGELCRAMVSKPLLCPFCRRPVGGFVRVVRALPRRR